MISINPINSYNFNKMSFGAWKKKSRVIEPPKDSKPYSIMAEIEKKNQAEKVIRQKAAKSLIHEEYRERNTIKEKALIYLPVLGALAAIRIFGRVKK